jgi:flagellar motility protein MotE (MotC chaperone)
VIKRLYQILAFVAVANLFAVGGLIGFLVASGRLNAERAEQIAVVLRGEFPRPAAQASRPASAPEEPQTSRQELVQNESRQRLAELFSDRRQRDIEDRNRLNQAMQMDVDRQLEQLHTREQEFQKERKKAREAATESSLQQVLDIYSDMEPKLAKDVLITRKDPDSVQILMRLDPGRRKKIVNTCKTAEEKAWISRILAQIGSLEQAGPDGQAASPPPPGTMGSAGPSPRP